MLDVKRVLTKTGYKTRIRTGEKGNRKYNYYKWKTNKTNENNVKKWEILHPYEDEVKQTKKPTKQEEQEVTVYKIKTSTHYDSKKNNSDFTYHATGIFENKPSHENIIKMVKNSLISAFNKGDINGGKYLKENVVNKLVGYEIVEARVKRSEITNYINAELTINNSGNIWKGTNRKITEW